MTGGSSAALSPYVAPIIAEAGERQCVMHLYAAYPGDFRDVAAELITRYVTGALSFETVDAALRANGFDWPNQ